MVDRSDDASCLLGLEGLAVERVVRTVLGVKIVQLVTDDPDAARCPGCAMVSTSGKDWPDFRRSQAHEGLIDWFRPGQDGVGWLRIRNRVGTRYRVCRWT